MQNKPSRTDFGALLARSWQLYSQSLHVTFSITLLCAALPLLILLVVLYYGLASAFEPALRVAQAVLMSLLESGFDEWAIGAAVEQVLSSFGGLNLPEVILRAVGSLGLTALALVLMLPVQTLCRLLLTPIGRGASVKAHLSAAGGEKPHFSASFSAIRRRFGRLIALDLLMIPVSAALVVIAAAAAAAAGKLPVAGEAVKLLAPFLVILLLGCARQIAAIEVLHGDARVFNAFGMAFKRFFTDWTYAAAGGLYYAALLTGGVLILAADVMLMVLTMLPPVMTVLYLTLFLPLGQAMNVVMAQEQDRRAEKSELPPPENQNECE